MAETAVESPPNTKRKPERIHFTQEKVAGLPAAKPGKRDWYRDDKASSLALMVTDRGVKTFYSVRWNPKKGKTEHFKLGPFPELSVVKARELVAKVGTDIAEGRDPVRERKEGRKELTFGEAFKSWRQMLEGKILRHQRSVRYGKDCDDLFKRNLESLKAKKLSQITRTDVRRVFEAVGKKAQTQANRTLALVSVVFNHAIDEGTLQGPNPASGIDRYPEVKRSRRILPAEMAGFLTAVEAESNATIRDYVLLSLYGAARRSNVLAMEWAEIDLETSIWHVPGAKTKNGDPLDVPLEPEEVEILKRRKEAADDDRWVFPGTGKTGHLVEPKAGWKRIRDSAGMPDLRLHDLRRTNASYQADEGASPLVIGRAIGDKSPAAVAVYTRVDLDPVRAAKRRALDAIKRDRERKDEATKAEEAGRDH